MVDRKYILLGIIFLGIALLWVKENLPASSPQVQVSATPEPQIHNSYYTAEDLSSLTFTMVAQFIPLVVMIVMFTVILSFINNAI